MIYNKIENTINKYNMLSVGDTVLVGVSGGADSMLLINALLSIKDKYQLTLKVAHIDHMFRGTDSSDDANFVKSFCDINNIEFHLLQIDAAKKASELKLGFEECSRNIRYDFFSSIECNKIATAHNLSDSVETLLFKLSRGTSLKGARGILPANDKLIRPIINLTSNEVRGACRELNIPYRIDYTNNDDNYSRNYIRNVLIPNFKKLNPSFELAVNRFINSTNEDYEFIEKYANDAYSHTVFDNKIYKNKLLCYENSIIKRVIIKYAQENNISLDYLHLSEVLTLFTQTKKTQIKNDVYFVSDKNYIYINNDKNTNDVPNNYDNIVLKMDEFLNIRELLQNQIDFYCDYDKINGNVVARNRFAGDKISPANRNCTKSLKKFFNEQKIPINIREGKIVLTDDSGIIGIIGYCCDERVKTDKNTQNVLIIKSPSEDN